MNRPQYTTLLQAIPAKQQTTLKKSKQMSYKYNKNNVKLAKILRKNMTPEEKHLWYDYLKKLPVTVHRQKNIGEFIVDFYIADINLVIEIDGRQHGEPENKEKDKERDEFLSSLGIKVRRISNFDINNNFARTCDEISDLFVEKK